VVLLYAVAAAPAAGVVPDAALSRFAGAHAASAASSSAEMMVFKAKPPS
jgi:hypothetical protein